MKIDARTALKYAGIRLHQLSEAQQALWISRIMDLYEKYRGEVHPKTFVFKSRLLWRDGTPVIEHPEMELPGKMAARRLSGCSEILVIAGTLGQVYEKILARLQKENPEEALLFDSLGSVWVEGVLDDLTDQLQKRLPDLQFTQRFSIGYEDLPLSLQKELFEKFDIASKTGIELQPSLMMFPTKSITAFIGLKPVEGDLRNTPSEGSCRDCSSDDCPFREQ